MIAGPTQEHTGPDREPALRQADLDEQRGHRRAVFLWFLCFALMILEARSGLVLTLLLACLKRGLDELCEARRVREDNGISLASRIVARFHIAYGATRASLSATFLMIGIVMAWTPLKNLGLVKAFPEPSQLVTAALIACSGFLVSGLLTVWAVRGALRHGVRVWIGGGSNRVTVMILQGMLCLNMATLFLILVPWNIVVPWNLVPVGNGNWVLGGGLLARHGTMLVMPALCVILLVRWLPRVAANSPEECGIYAFMDENARDVSEPEACARWLPMVSLIGIGSHDAKRRYPPDA